MALAIIGGIVAAVGIGAGIFNSITSAQQAEKARKALDKSQAKVRAALDSYNLSETERLKAQQMMNDAIAGKNTARINDLITSLNAANDAFSLSTQESIDAYAAGMDAMLAKQDIDLQEAINAYSTATINSINEAYSKKLEVAQMTAQERQALLDQFNADSQLNIANYIRGSGVVNQEQENALNQIVANYDQSQAARNQQLEQLQSTATGAFKDALQTEAAVRDKIVGDVLKSTGQVLANTNEGISKLLGTTPEENLERAKQASNDFATYYATNAGEVARNNAQQAARQGGLSPGAAALMGATASTQAVRDSYAKGSEIGLSQYNTAQQLQQKALEDQYARQKELAQMQLDQARLSEQQDAANANAIANMENQNALDQAKMQQQDSLSSAQMDADAAKTIQDDKQHAIDTATGLEQDRLDTSLSYADQSAKDLGQQAIDAESTKSKDTQDAAKNALDAEKSRIENAAKGQQDKLDTISNKQDEKNKQELINSTNTANTISNETKEADNQALQNQKDLLDASRQQDLTNIDTNLNMANQDAGISGNASNLANQALQNTANQLTQTGGNIIEKGGQVEAINESSKTEGVK